MNKISVQTLDDFIPDPEKFREYALSLHYYTIRGPDGERYTNVHVFPSDLLEATMSNRLGRKVTVDHNLFRLNPTGDNHRIHADIAHSDYAFVLYLNPPEQCRGGTAFWRYRKFGWTDFPSAEQIKSMGKSPARVCEEIMANHKDLSKWDQVHLCEMKFNRMICYPTRHFHSRWPLEGWGDAAAQSRLVAVGFFGVE